MAEWTMDLGSVTGSNPVKCIFSKIWNIFCSNLEMFSLGSKSQFQFYFLKNVNSVFSNCIFMRKTEKKKKEIKITNIFESKLRFKTQFALNSFQNLNFLLITNFNSEKDSIWNLIVKFYKLWPPFQWATSLLTLILIYWATGYYYNKFLSQRSGWMGVKARISMISLDLLLNFILGIYYMNYRETFIGTLMIQCPVFCSPIFWLLELICFYIYYKYEWIFKKKK